MGLGVATIGRVEMLGGAVGVVETASGWRERTGSGAGVLVGWPQRQPVVIRLGFAVVL